MAVTQGKQSPRKKTIVAQGKIEKKVVKKVEKVAKVEKVEKKIEKVEKKAENPKPVMLPLVKRIQTAEGWRRAQMRKLKGRKQKAVNK